MWQDVVFSVGGILIILFFIPALFDKQKAPLQTSIPNSLILISFSAAQFSLKLWTLAVPTLIVAVLWTMLAYQRIKQGKVVIKTED